MSAASDAGGATGLAWDEPLSAAPYPGLRPFEKTEWPIFFGRETMVRDVVVRLGHRHLVAIHGESGCGKSSLVRAGVLPFLEGDQAQAGGTWRTVEFRPGDAPVENLAAALAGLLPGPHDADPLQIRRLLLHSETAPGRVASAIGCDDTASVCVLFDQFEEVFDHARRHGPTAAEALTGFLVGLVRNPPPGFHVIVTMRSEYLGQCAQWRGLAEVFNETQYLVPRMERRALWRAIREPAELFGGSIAPELVEQLAEDAGYGQDHLPLIQHGLMRLWQRRTGGDPHARNWRIGMDDYRSAGDLASMLDGHAETLFASVDPLVAETVFRALADRNADGQAIRRPRTLGDLAAVAGVDADAVAATLAPFRAATASFVRPYGSGPLTADTRIDISHESFLRSWKRCAMTDDGWLRREVDDGLRWTALRLAADDFARSPLTLLSGGGAEDARDLMNRHNAAWADRYGGGWDDVLALVNRSRQAAEEAGQDRERAAAAQARAESAFALVASERTVARRTRLGFVAASVLALASLALGLFALDQQREAETARGKAETERLEAISAAELAEEERQRAVAARNAADAARIAADAATSEATEARSRADAERQRADEQARKAKANETVGILAVARAELEAGHLSNAIRLALAAWPRTGDPDRPQMRSAVDTVTTALKSLRERQRLVHLPLADSPQQAIFVTSAAISNDGSIVVTGSNDNTIMFWDATTGHPVAGPVLHGPRNEHGETRIRRILFAPDSFKVVTGSDDGSARVWDGRTGAPIGEAMRHDGAILRARFSWDARKVVTGSMDTTARVWDAETGIPLTGPLKHLERVNDARFAPRGDLVLTASDDKTAQLWSTSTGVRFGHPMRHGNAVVHTAISFDGRMVATASREHRALVWDVESGQVPIRDLRHRDRVWGVAFSVNNRDLLTFAGPRRMSVWDIESRAASPHTDWDADEELDSSTWDENLSRIIGSSRQGAVQVWDRSGARRSANMKMQGRAWGVLVSQHSRRIVSWSSRIEDPIAYLWELDDVSETATLWNGSGATDMALPADGARIVTLHADGSMAIWNSATAEVTHTIRPEGESSVVTLSPNGTRILTAKPDGTVRLWSGETGAPGASFRHKGIASAAFSPDGTMAVTGAKDGTVWRWNTATGAPVGKVIRHGNEVTAIAFVPNGQKFASVSSSGTVQVRDAATGARVGGLLEHKSRITRSVFSADGARLLTVGEDNKVLVWDVATGREVSNSINHNDTIWSAVFSPDGQRVITASADNTAKIWDAATGRRNPEARR